MRNARYLFVLGVVRILLREWRGSIQRYSIELGETARSLVERIARYSIELGVVRRMLGEM